MTAASILWATTCARAVTEAKIKMEIATESKSGSRDSDAEVAGCEKRMKETDYDSDGRLKLEIEWNPMKLQIQTLLSDMDRLMTSGEGEDEGRNRIVQSQAKKLLRMVELCRCCREA